jgi:hypothetical protein
MQVWVDDNGRLDVPAACRQCLEGGRESHGRRCHWVSPLLVAAYHRGEIYTVFGGVKWRFLVLHDVRSCWLHLTINRAVVKGLKYTLQFNGADFQRLPDRKDRLELVYRFLESRNPFAESYYFEFWDYPSVGYISLGSYTELPSPDVILDKIEKLI